MVWSSDVPELTTKAVVGSIRMTNHCLFANKQWFLIVHFDSNMTRHLKKGK